MAGSSGDAPSCHYCDHFAVMGAALDGLVRIWSMGEHALSFTRAQHMVMLELVCMPVIFR